MCMQSEDSGATAKSPCGSLVELPKGRRQAARRKGFHQNKELRGIVLTTLDCATTRLKSYSSSKPQETRHDR